MINNSIIKNIDPRWIIGFSKNVSKFVYLTILLFRRNTINNFQDYEVCCFLQGKYVAWQIDSRYGSNGNLSKMIY